MKTVILCGGKGTRLREETEFRPKPMVPIGERPILWHIMKIYAAQGHKDFVLCLGYKGDTIKDYFRNYLWMASDITLNLGPNPNVQIHGAHAEEDWSVTLAETGQEAQTACRIKRIERYIGSDDCFLLTYGDGVGNVDVNAAIAEHRRSGKICTVTGVHPPGRFGELGLGSDRRSVTSFNEKPQAEGGFINGGFMVCNREIFHYLSDDPTDIFEKGALRVLAAEGKLGTYLHEGFWQPMDTFMEFTLLNRLWAESNAPWKIW